MYVVCLKTSVNVPENKQNRRYKFSLLAFKIIAILHNTLLATFINFWKLSAKASLGIDRRTAVTRSCMAATWQLEL
jgi:hypothetical protein